MKKQVLVLLISAMFVTAGYAQQRGQRGGGADRQERQKQQTEKLKKDLKLDKDQVKKFDAVYKKFDEERTKMMEDMRSDGGDFQGMREKMTEMNTKRDVAVKKLLTKAQVKTYDKILKEQAKLRAERGRGRGGRR